ncbi:hypothetical protein N7509_001140 [Penicillium cosmopolitanum]|uniref:Tubby C-terminal domain-containing protein n=1 Tax=Penicillium cosmopolitanum TaxID=1131564 RepID=A0A9X0BEW4_9EURO|nr:uncharacterized protein N7509_001140 [Penicillium cosmopolitanum]KAJ5414513.1 hypothetical protein N7509_001140 [Penicillium cosmopolitanum]
MFTSHLQSRKPLSNPPPERPRKAFRPPHRQIAFRKEYIATSETRLVLKPQGDAQSAVSFKIIDDEDGSVKFTVSGRKYGNRACREFRDSSGLPLFELHRKALFTHSWFITLPGSDHASIARAAPKWSFTQGFDDFSLSFENQAAVDAKGQEERRVELNIERHGTILALYDVVDGDRKVAVVRESIQRNEILPFMNSRWRRYKPILEVTVTSGADMSMAAAIAVILSDWVFKTGWVI